MAKFRLITSEPDPKLVIGERVLADIRRRAHELSGRFRPTLSEKRELAKLIEFLRLQATGGEHD